MMETNSVSGLHDEQHDMNTDTRVEEVQNNHKRRKVLKIGEVVERLSEIYGFDLREAQEHLGMDNDGRLKKGRPRILKDESQNAEEKTPKKRGRPPSKKKDESEDEVPKVPKKRGRPRKIVEYGRCIDMEELIASLLKQQEPVRYSSTTNPTP